MVTNQSYRAGDGRHLFRKLSRDTDNFLDVVLRHAGDVPHDRYLIMAVQEQRAVVEAYPHSPSGAAFREIAATIDALPAAREPSGGIDT